MKIPNLKLSETGSKYGSQMGRRDELPENPNVAGRLRLTRMRMIGGDYDTGYAYWGGGGGVAGDMYCAHGDLPGEEFTTYIFVRGRNREAARARVLEVLPNVRIRK